MYAVSPWWRPENHQDRRPRLIARQAIATALRAHFTALDFVEVDPHLLQVSPGNETHLHAFATAWKSLSGEEIGLYLHTSPEFACKKLLSAGETRIFTLSHVLRNRELGPLHQPEFTMLEWYRAGATADDLMRDCADILNCAAEATGTRLVNYRDCICDPRATPDRLSVADAFSRFTGIDLLATIAPDGGTDRDRLLAETTRLGLRTSDDDSWSDLFSRILSDRVEPRLGIGKPSLLTDYPLPEAALAKRSERDPRLSERFELYVCGIELANAFEELTDTAEQRRRFEADMDEKQRIYGERYPIDDDFLEALRDMPPAAGAALGFDRLVMLMTGAERIADVMWTPFSPPGDAGR